MYISSSNEFKKMVYERAKAENTTVSKYVISKMIETWQREGLSFTESFTKSAPKDPRLCKTYEKDGIIYTDKYDYEFCKKVMDMYHVVGSTRSIAKYLGKHQKTIWRIVDRNLNKGDE